MYLVSIYFNKETNRRIQQYISQVAKHTGNFSMIEGQVPPHITVSAFEVKNEEKAISTLKRTFKYIKRGTLQFASVGQFFPYVIYLAPVLNEYLQGVSEIVYENLSQLEDIKISPFYRPFQWMPHATIGKKLSKEEMQKAFQVLQGSFGVFSTEVVKIGLAKTNPYQEIVNWGI